MTGRVWGGLTADERDQRRRDQLVDAALTVFSADGWHGATVSRICAEARLSPRYFYEAFDSREALFAALVEQIMEEITTLALQAVATEDRDPRDRARDTLAALADYAAADPRAVRVALVEAQATPAGRELRAQMLGAFSALAARLMRGLNPAADPEQLALAARVLAGGLAELLAAGATIDPERLEPLFTAAAQPAPD